MRLPAGIVRLVLIAAGTVLVIIYLQRCGQQTGREPAVESANPPLPVPVAPTATETPSAPKPPPASIAKKAAEPATPAELPSLKVEFSLPEGAALGVENKDTADWKKCEAYLNGHGFSLGYKLALGSIAAGETRTYPLSEFADSDGKRFDPYSLKVLTGYISCTTPRGEQSYAAKSSYPGLEGVVRPPRS
jgi:hypothetical protein